MANEGKRLNWFQRQIEAAKTWFFEGVWETRHDGRCCFTFLRFVSKTVDMFFKHRCALHAAGLTYYSVLAIVPVLALTLMLVKPCGLYDWSRTQLVKWSDTAITRFFDSSKSAPAEKSEQAQAPAPAAAPTPAGEQGSAPVANYGAQIRELRDGILKQVDDKVNNFKFSVMTFVGLGILVWTVVCSLFKVETSLNEIWEVKEARGLPKRFGVYLASLIVLPILMAFSMALPVLKGARALAEVMGKTDILKWFADVLSGVIDSSLMPVLVAVFALWLALVYVMKVLPNCKVSLWAAVRGSLLMMIFQAVFMGVIVWVQFGISSSSAAFGSFAMFPILLVWTYYSWQIFLLGSTMTYAFQHLNDSRGASAGAGAAA